MENPIKMDDLGVCTPILGNLQMFIFCSKAVESFGLLSFLFVSRSPIVATQSIMFAV